MLFRYFFPVRHTQYQLNEVWRLLTRRSDNRSREFRFVMMLHNQMLHVINSFWNYFQYDILELQWQRLLDRIQVVTDFE